MGGEQPELSRRGFAQRLGQVAAASTLATLNAPAVHGAEGNTIQFALVGCGGRGTGAVVDAFATKNGPLKLVAMADIFEDKLTRSFKSLANRIGDGMAVKDDTQVPRLRRLPEGDGRAQAGRRRHPRDAAGLPLGALRLRDQEGPQRLHGEAGHRRRPDLAEDVRARRAVGAQEPQGRRRPDVPALRRAQRTATPRSRTARSARSSRCAPTACTARRFGLHQEAGEERHHAAGRRRRDAADDRGDVPAAPVPRLPVGVGRHVLATSTSTTSTRPA